MYDIDNVITSRMIRPLCGMPGTITHKKYKLDSQYNRLSMSGVNIIFILRRQSQRANRVIFLPW